MAIRKAQLVPCCERCGYFEKIPDDDLGHCRRYPITAGSDDWPTVYLTDWCGEYKNGPRHAEQAEAIEHLSIAEAGKKYFGLSVNGSYLAAKRGDLPWVRIGNKKRVPISALRHLTPRE